MKSNSLSPRKREIIAYILLILTAIIWGGTWPIGRWLVAEEVGGKTIPPFMIATIRYIIAVVCLFIILKLKEGTLNLKFAKKYWKILFLMGLLSVTIYQAGYLLGELFTAASDASIMVATNAVWVVILSSIFLKTEHFSWRKIIGTLLAFSAVIIVVGFSPNVNVSNRILGDILILLAALAYALYSVISRFFMNKTKENPEFYQPTSLWIITWVSFLGLITTAPIGLALSPQYFNPLEYLNVPIRVWWGIAYLALISSILAYTFYLEGIKRLDTSRAAIFQTLVPLFGVLFSAIFLQEEFDILIYPFALIFVISGISLVNLKRPSINIDFEKIDENDLLIQMESNYKMFKAAILKMKMVDNFDHTIPSGLNHFVDFFYSHHENVYQNEKNPKIIYKEFLNWLRKKKG